MRRAINYLFVSALFFSGAGVCAEMSYSELSKLYENKNFDVLERHCKEIIDKHDRSSEKYLEASYFQAAVHFYQGNIDEAVEAMLKFEKSHDLVSKNDKSGIPEEKQDDVKFINIDARFSGLYYELGKYYFIEKQDYSEAYNWLIRAKSNNRYYNDRMFNFFIGTASAQTGRYEEARKYYHRQLEHYPDEYSAYYNIAATYALQGKESKAIDWLGKAISYNDKYKSEAKNDPDFDSINSAREFIELTNK